jgi:hypothetical protein
MLVFFFHLVLVAAAAAAIIPALHCTHYLLAFRHMVCPWFLE